VNALFSYLARFHQKHLLDKKFLPVPSYQVARQIGDALANEWGVRSEEEKDGVLKKCGNEI
jgi:hypothetical protein